MPLDRLSAGAASPQVSTNQLAGWIGAGWSIDAQVVRQAAEIVQLRYCYWRPVPLEVLAERYGCARETVRKREIAGLAALRLVPELWRDQLPDGCRLAIALAAAVEVCA
jgi:hypothetical protein